MAIYPTNRRTFLKRSAAFLATTSIAGCGGHLASAIPAAEVGPYPDNEPYPLVVSPSLVRAEIESANPNLRILDASSLATYREGHVPGAEHVWWQDTMEWNNPVYGRVLGPDSRPQLFRNLRIASDSMVFVYDNDLGQYAARIVWMMRFLQLPHAALVDGGFAGWRGIDGDVSRQPAGFPSVESPRSPRAPTST